MAEKLCVCQIISACILIDVSVYLTGHLDYDVTTMEMHSCMSTVTCCMCYVVLTVLIVDEDNCIYPILSFINPQDELSFPSPPLRGYCIWACLYV